MCVLHQTIGREIAQAVVCCDTISEGNSCGNDIIYQTKGCAQALTSGPVELEKEIWFKKNALGSILFVITHKIEPNPS